MGADAESTPASGNLYDCPHQNKSVGHGRCGYKRVGERKCSPPGRPFIFEQPGKPGDLAGYIVQIEFSEKFLSALLFMWSHAGIYLTEGDNRTTQGGSRGNQSAEQFPFLLSSPNRQDENVCVQEVGRHLLRFRQPVFSLETGFGFRPHLTKPVPRIVDFGMIFGLPDRFGVLEDF